MNKKQIFFALLVTFCFGVFMFALPADAAILNISVEKNIFNIGDEFIANIKIDSENIGINAAQATLQYPKDIVDVISFDKTSSVFNFWLDEPAFSNSEGVLKFIGGTTTGFSGKTLQILKVVFKVKGTGNGFLTFTDAAVTASDGSGTNVLSSVQGIDFSSVTKGAAAGIPSIIPAPQQIIRSAVEATGAPAKPALKVPLYPDPAVWNNFNSKFSAEWNLPADIISVATKITKDPFFNVATAEGLFDSEIYPPLDDGAWYLHVRFKNNIGWGPTAHWRIAIDTAPPLSFDIKVAEGLSTDIPSLSLDYKSGDSLSGIDHYSIRVDDSELIITDKFSYVLPPQSPGTHLIKISAFDKAGNATENSVSVEILPIASPIIVSAPSNVIFGESIAISGSALPDTTVRISLKGNKGQVAAFKEIRTNEKGGWRAEFSEPLPTGKYYAEVQSIDNRGAQSLVVKSSAINLKAKPLLIIGGIELSTGAVFTITVLILLVLFLINWYLIRVAKEQQRSKIIISQREVIGIFGIIKKDIDKILESFKDKALDDGEINEIEQLLKKSSQKLEEMPKYIAEGIEEIAEREAQNKIQNYMAGKIEIVKKAASNFIKKIKKQIKKL